MKEKKKVILAGITNWFNALLVVIYFAFAYFVSCLFLNMLIPRFIPTEQTAQQFWAFGTGALILCGGGFVLLKVAKDSSACTVQCCTLRAMGLAFEGLVFFGAIAIWIEAGEYAAWVGQFEPITAHSGVDARYWVAGVLLVDGVIGNLLAALLTA